MSDRMLNMDGAAMDDVDTDVRDLLGTGLIGSRLVGAAKAATAIHMCLLTQDEEQGRSLAPWFEVTSGTAEVRS